MAARPGPRDTVLPSVLDRLLDDEPDQKEERPKPPSQALRDLRAAVMRDVSALLNTRRRWPPPPPELTELIPSVEDYGIPDLTGAELGNPAARDEFRRLIEETIRRYEPRFRRVRVELVEAAEKGDRTLRLRVDALMHADPVPEQLVFDSVLDPVQGSLEVEE
jgi:type VI secretion system protein ImpF